MDVGTTLRTGREGRGMTLLQLATRTKIPMTILAAIEENDFDQVPSGIFIRGYIRAYAREVGLAPEPIVAQFLADTAPVTPIGSDQPSPERPVDDALESVRLSPDLLQSSRAGWGYALIVAALLVAIISFNRSNTPDAEAVAVVPPVEQPVRAAAVIAAEAGPVGTSGSGVRMEMQAQRLCWVRVSVDGKTLVARLMQPGERETFDATGEIILRVGDPGAITYSLNGRPGTPLGKAGVPVTVRFTRDGGPAALVS
jgi:cytoskeletal protein RodZ